MDKYVWKTTLLCSVGFTTCYNFCTCMHPGHVGVKLGSSGSLEFASFPAGFQPTPAQRVVL